MPKKKIKEAIEEAHEMADKAIDDAQAEIEETRNELKAWFNSPAKVTNGQLLIVAVVTTVLILL